METVIVLNQDYQFLNKISWQKAICLIVKGKVEVLRHTAKVIRNAEHTIEIFIPKVLRLLKLVRAIYKNKVPFSKRNVMVRDEFTCQYCRAKDTRLTVDHVIPKSRGGKTTFENCVSACKNCNSEKANKTPSEAKMYLKKQPDEPTINQFIQITAKNMGISDLINDLFKELR